MVRHLTQLERIRRWVNDNKALALLFDIKYKGTHLGNDAARFRGGMTTVRRKPRALQQAVHVANGNVRIGGGPSMVRSEESRVGKECVSTCSSRGLPDH